MHFAATVERRRPAMPAQSSSPGTQAIQCAASATVFCPFLSTPL